jgi:dsDNA-binding SOS-regulon protein
MAVITRFIVVRDGVELDQVFSDKKEAEAYDQMLDAAQHLAALIKQADIQVNIDPKTIDDISIYLAKNAAAVVKLLKSVKPLKPVSKDTDKAKATQDEPVEDKKKALAPKAKSKTN